MQVNLMPQNYQSVPTFGQKYPYADVMSIMSGSYVEKVHKSAESTVASMLHKKISSEPNERLSDEICVRRMLWNSRQDLMPYAKSFREALDKINMNHFAIKSEDAQQVVEKEMQKYGSRTIDIEF